MIRSRRLLAVGVLAVLATACQNALTDVYFGEDDVDSGVVLLTVSGDNDPNEENLGANGKIVYWPQGDEYVLFYRSRDTNSRWGIRRATSPDGVSFTSTGWAIRPHMGTGDSLGCGGAYDPGAVVAADGTIALVYEAEPKESILSNAPMCEDNPEGNNGSYVAVARSVDGGVSFDNFDKIVYTTTGVNVGTPSIHIIPGRTEIAVLYHRNPGNAGPGNPLTNRMRIWRYDSTHTINDFEDSARLRDNELNINWPNGQNVITGTWGFFGSAGGIGKSDITHWRSGANGTDDNGYYLIWEAWPNAPLCGQGPVLTLYARSGTFDGTYTVSASTPLPVDTTAFNDCDEDMPTWFYRQSDGTFHLLLHQKNGLSDDTLEMYQFGD